ncbi:kappa-ctenitoxin-Pn1a-like [Stegodyphus dumicola]|uniref:kappa-ctenitoxin-Pn1a-like n=1 Tax=Stegodyphus dumicola TaxID=202533 RepID=UPI0015AF91BE|nr:kappa-ctenitoxin-Pn1a-like [Stegodyphus dumicola]
MCSSLVFGDNLTKMNVHLIAIVVLLLAVEAVRSDTLQDAGLLPEARERCAKPNETCSKGRRGSGPSECCPPKGCSCNPFTSYCDCSWDSWW